MLSLSSSASSLVPSVFTPPSPLSTPPLNRTAVLACYHAWSIPCYHREINYLGQAAGERGNNERTLLPSQMMAAVIKCEFIIGRGDL